MEDTQLYEADSSGHETATSGNDIYADQKSYVMELVRAKEFTLDVLLEALAAQASILQDIQEAKVVASALLKKQKKRPPKAVDAKATRHPLVDFLHTLLVDFYAERRFCFAFLPPKERLRLLETFDELCGASALFTGISMFVAHSVLTDNMLQIIRSPDQLYSRIPNLMRADSAQIHSHTAKLLKTAHHIDGHLDLLGIPKESGFTENLNEVYEAPARYAASKSADASILTGIFDR